MERYGKELILDIHDCKVERVTRGLIRSFMVELCDLIDMEREDLHFWDYNDNDEAYQDAPAHLKGTSALQFIKTSNITIHTLDEMKRAYLNIFSCKDFSNEKVIDFCHKIFGGVFVTCKEVSRI